MKYLILSLLLVGCTSENADLKLAANRLVCQVGYLRSLTDVKDFIPMADRIKIIETKAWESACREEYP